MTAGSEFVHAASRAAAARLLRQAAKFTAMHANKAVLEKTMRLPSTPAVLVRFDYPGVLRVFDRSSGELLAESEPGAPAQLAGAVRVLSSPLSKGNM